MRLCLGSRISMTNSNKPTKTIPVLVAIVITTMTIASLNTTSLLSIASAQSKPDNVLGTIASLQNGKDGKPAWVTSGIVDIKG